MFPKFLVFLRGKRSKLCGVTKLQGFPFYSFAEAADCGVAVPKVPLTGLPEYRSINLCKNVALQGVEK